MRWHRALLSRLLKRNFDRDAAYRTMAAFATIAGEDGDRITEHLARRFKLFESEALDPQRLAYQRGVRDVILEIEELRQGYAEKLEALRKKP